MSERQLDGLHAVVQGLAIGAWVSLALILAGMWVL